MKKISNTNMTKDEMKSEYVFDYQKAKSNRFAGQSDDTRTVVVLDPYLSTVFSTPDAVNQVLRALVKTMPSRPATIKNQRKARTAG
jgi:uracil phosphoribosyltransferase